MELADNKVLITGATAGIGKALAKEFLHHNSTVIAVGRDKRKFRNLQAMPDHIIPFQCDLADPM